MGNEIDIVREKNRERQKKWRDANPERAAVIRRKSYTNNIETYKRCAKAWYEKNREHSLARSNQWKKDNPDKVRLSNQTRRARQIAATGSHTQDDLNAIMKAQKGRCAYCRIKFCESVPPTVDHIISLARGGTNDKNNIQYACGSCNFRKHKRDPIDFARSIGRLI